MECDFYLTVQIIEKIDQKDELKILIWQEFSITWECVPLLDSPQGEHNENGVILLEM